MNGFRLDFFTDEIKNIYRLNMENALIYQHSNIFKVSVKRVLVSFIIPLVTTKQGK